MSPFMEEVLTALAVACAVRLVKWALTEFEVRSAVRELDHEDAWRP
jgi:hypothetical protein